MKGIALFVVPRIAFALPLPAMADSRQIGTIKISNYTIAADPQLHPGELGVLWDGSGPDFQGTFVDERAEVASLPATLITNRNNLETRATPPSIAKTLRVFKCSHVLTPRMNKQGLIEAMHLQAD